MAVPASSEGCTATRRHRGEHAQAASSQKVKVAASREASAAGDHEPKDHACARALAVYAMRGKLKGLNVHGSTVGLVATQASNHVLRASCQRATVCCERQQSEQLGVASYNEASNCALRATSQRMHVATHVIATSIHMRVICHYAEQHS
eukprot:8201938-Alexandrium_andersonii.AAC.1